MGVVAMMRRAAVLAALALMFAASAAGAQKTGPNGGMLSVATAGPQLELVVGFTELTVYILEKGKVVETTGAALRATVQQSGATTTLELVDQQGKRLVAKLAAPLPTGTTVIVSGKNKHGHLLNGRFVVVTAKLSN
jgi:hypothetical protein